MEPHQKEYLKLKYFFPLRILTSPLFEETLEAFHFLPLFLCFLLFFSFFQHFFSLFSMLRLLRTLAILMIFEEKDHFFKNFLFKWLDME
jgi:hypothetical protein